MSKALDLHSKASEISFQALQAKKKGDFPAFLELSRAAFEKEREAALLLKDNFTAEPTRSVLFRSAATLALNCGDYDEAVKMVSFALIGNAHNEIKSELFDVINSISQEATFLFGHETPREENAYVYFLREHAIHFKIESRDVYHSKAISLESVFDGLKGLKNSIMNYLDVSFRKAFDEHIFDNFDRVLGGVKKDLNPLLVNLNFKSFGASISLDNKIMGKVVRKEVMTWKKSVFSNFKKEVINLDYDSEKEIKKVVEKYSKEERNRIYLPLVDMLKENSKFKLSITDEHFKSIEKSFEPLNPRIKNILVPPLDLIEEKENEKFLVQSYALTNEPDKFKKGDVFQTESVEYAEINFQVTQITYNETSLFVRNPYSLKVIWRERAFHIDDSNFEIVTSGKTYGQVVQDYNKIVIETFNRLVADDESKLSLNEKSLKDRLLDVFTFSS